jgi:hypothetical protein
MLNTVTIAAGATVPFVELGNFFRLMQASQAVDVFFYFQGSEVARSEGVSGGYAETFANKFDRITIKSATAQTIQYVARLGNNVKYDTPPNGNVTVTNTAGAFVNAQETVTNASTTIIVANAVRRYLLVQNNDSSGDVYLRFDGGVATIGTGIKLKPGESIELQGYVPTGAVTAIGSIASNANVVSVEG